MITVRRSLLFVPASRPDRFAKALASGADRICIDLEDAVLPADKESAREAVVAFLAAHTRERAEIVVRTNPVNTDDGQADLLALADFASKLSAVMLAKTEFLEDLEDASEMLADGEHNLIALIESPIGLLNARQIAAGANQLQGFMFGGADFCAQLRGEMTWEAMYFARAELSTIAAAYQIDMIDVPFIDIQNIAGLEQECGRIKAMGLTCKAAIHPSQVSVINGAFSPTQGEIEWAEKVIGAHQKSGGGVFVVDGKMIDRPIVLAAERVVAIREYLQAIG